MTAAQRSGSELAAVVLALGCARHYLWPLVPLDAGGSVWKIGSAVAICGLAWLLWLRDPGQWLGWVLAWFAFEESQVIVGEVWWLIDPWPVPDGMGIMEARSGLSLATLGLMIVAYFAVRLSLPARADRIQNQE